MKTLQQKRAWFALQCVKRVKKLKEGKWLVIKDIENIEEIECKPIELLKIGEYKTNFFEKLPLIWDYLKTKDKYKNLKIEKDIKDILEQFSTDSDLIKVEKDKEYGRYAKNLPAMITTNGLIPTIAFYMKDEVKKQIVEDIKEELKKVENQEIKKSGSLGIENDFLTFLTEMEAPKLRMYTKNVLSFAEWLKRMAEVEIETGE